MASSIEVLVVADDLVSRTPLFLSFTNHGFKVRQTVSRATLDALLDKPIHLVLVYATRPEVSATQLCLSIRAFDPWIGIVIISNRNLEEERISVLEAGADDFVTEPMAPRELIARLRAITRRHHSDGGLAPPRPLRAGCLELDIANRVLRKSGIEIHLTPKEFDIVAVLMRHLDQPVSHRKLLQTVWGPEYGSETEYLRSYVKMVRKKIEEDPKRPVYLVTEPWAGYRLRKPGETAS